MRLSNTLPDRVSGSARLCSTITRVQFIIRFLQEAMEKRVGTEIEELAADVCKRFADPLLPR